MTAQPEQRSGSGPGPVLDVLGLTEQEERAYRWLVDKGLLPIGEVAAAWQQWCRADEVAETLAGLHHKGLVSLLPGPPYSVQASSPEAVLDRLVSRREEELRSARRLIADLTQRHRVAPQNGSSRDVMDIVYGREAVVQRGLSMLNDTRHQFRGFDKPPYYSDTNDIRDELAVLARGLRCRCVYDLSALEVPGYLAVIEQLVAAGEEARVLDGVPMKMGIADDREALLPLQRDGAVVAELFIRSSALLDALGNLFEMVWDRATPLHVAAARVGVEAPPAGEQAPQPAPDELRVLALLITGLPDESICRRLGISQRTLQRRLQGMQTRLGARTRSQLAYLAARRNWI
ncbi:MAG TPA: LuxR C-terminal-related transcriptional regulator [Mycobacteriales bacterium]|nr:LuxR C-terminal-related transcriptional regulator [Mycobacteriales bacterium]